MWTFRNKENKAEKDSKFWSMERGWQKNLSPEPATRGGQLKGAQPTLRASPLRHRDP